MKLLLDECIVQDFRHLLSAHEIFTVAYNMGWAGIKNGRLLAIAAQNGFKALVTTDRGMDYQQNPNTLPLSVIILDAASNDVDDLTALVPNLEKCLSSLRDRQIYHVR